MTIEQNASQTGTSSQASSCPRWHTVEPGMAFKVIISSGETGGAYAIVESVVEPGGGSIMHMHHKEDEYFLVLEGVAHVVVDGVPLDLYPGQSTTLPREIPHAWINRSDQRLRLLSVFSPGGFEQLGVDIAEIGGMEKYDLSQIRPKYGLDALGPKLDVETLPVIPS